ncbi:MAG: CvpA family protein [Candidatus Margulisbacteria bacterium]|nr:CvpA family protein [Candidatus Margulisiibacteriota bacterium]
MLDVVVGIVVALFILLGAREGIAKSLGSLAMVFVALFLAGSAIGILGQSNAQFNDPQNTATILTFLFVWLVVYLILDLLLILLLKKIINITVLGPADKIGGLIIGGCKGIMICGVILQLIIGLPISADSRAQIVNSPLASFSIAAYQWAYPYTKQFVPAVNSFKQNLIKQLDQTDTQKAEEQPGSGEFVEKVMKQEPVKTDADKKIMKLLKEQKLLPDAPEKK